MATRWAGRVAFVGWLGFVALVLVFGNPWATRFWASHPLGGGVLGFPAWSLRAAAGAAPSSPEVGRTVRTVLLVVVVGVLLYLTARSLRARPARLGVVLMVWPAIVVAAGFAGLLAALVVDTGLQSFPTGSAAGVLTEMGNGVAYGFWVGWLPAVLAALLGRPPAGIVAGHGHPG